MAPNTKPRSPRAKNPDVVYPQENDHIARVMEMHCSGGLCWVLSKRETGESKLLFGRGAVHDPNPESKFIYSNGGCYSSVERSDYWINAWICHTMTKFLESATMVGNLHDEYKLPSKEQLNTLSVHKAMLDRQRLNMKKGKARNFRPHAFYLEQPSEYTSLPVPGFQSLIDTAAKYRETHDLQLYFSNDGATSENHRAFFTKRNWGRDTFQTPSTVFEGMGLGTRREAVDKNAPISQYLSKVCVKNELRPYSMRRTEILSVVFDDVFTPEHLIRQLMELVAGGGWRLGRPNRPGMATIPYVLSLKDYDGSLTPCTTGRMQELGDACSVAYETEPQVPVETQSGSSGYTDSLAYVQANERTIEDQMKQTDEEYFDNGTVAGLNIDEAMLSSLLPYFFGVVDELEPSNQFSPLPLQIPQGGYTPNPDFILGQRSASTRGGPASKRHARVWDTFDSPLCF